MNLSLSQADYTVVTPNVSGVRVIDFVTGKPVQGAHVTIQLPEKNVAGGMTNESGVFAVPADHTTVDMTFEVRKDTYYPSQASVIPGKVREVELRPHGTPYSPPESSDISVKAEAPVTDLIKPWDVPVDPSEVSDTEWGFDIEVPKFDIKDPTTPPIRRAAPGGGGASQKAGAEEVKGKGFPWWILLVVAGGIYWASQE